MFVNRNWTRLCVEILGGVGVLLRGSINVRLETEKEEGMVVRDETPKGQADGIPSRSVSPPFLASRDKERDRSFLREKYRPG